VSDPYVVKTRSAAATCDLGRAIKTYQFGRPLSHGLTMYAKDSSPDEVTRRKQRFKRIPVRLYPFFGTALAI
jgi:hypothetical protein